MFWFLLILLLLIFFAPRIINWYARYKLRAMQRQFMRGMGMDPDGETSRRTPRGRRDRREADGSRSRRRRTEPEEKIIPRDYGEDVEYTEVHEYSETVKVSVEDADKRCTTRVEAQMTDAEWVEIKE